MDSQFIVFSKKMGITSEFIIRKAIEIHRIYKCKMSLESQFLNISNEIVICLYLSAQQYNEPVEQKAAEKFSGLSSKKFSIALNAFRSFTTKVKKTDIKTLSIYFGCTEALSLSLKVYNWYIKREGRNFDMDFTLPLFSCAALLTASKKMKIALDTKKLIAIAGTTREVLNSLVAKMSKHPEITQNEGKPTDEIISESVHIDEEKDNRDTKHSKRRALLSYDYDNEEDERSYQLWRQKLLQA